MAGPSQATRSSVASAESLNRRFQDTARQRAPAGMRGAKRRAVSRRQHHWKTVCGKDRQHLAAGVRHGRVGDGVARQIVAAGDRRAVHLSQPARRTGQTERPGQAGPILGHVRRKIVHVIAKVQGVDGAALTPPARVVVSACTPAGAGQSARTTDSVFARSMA